VTDRLRRASFGLERGGINTRGEAHVEGNGSKERNEEKAREDQGGEARCKGRQGGEKTLMLAFATPT
jgi:hypothetical protein